MLDAQLIAGLNVSLTMKQALENSTHGFDVDIGVWEKAQTEIFKLLTNDRFAHFRHSEIYVTYLEQLLLPEDALKWAKSLDELLANPV